MNLISKALEQSPGKLPGDNGLTELEKNAIESIIFDYMNGRKKPNEKVAINLKTASRKIGLNRQLINVIFGD